EWQRRRREDPIADADALAAADDADHLWDEDFRRTLLRRAFQIMEHDFQPATWRACWEVIVQGRTAAEGGDQLGMSVGAVYAARFRVLSRLRQELTDMFD